MHEPDVLWGCEPDGSPKDGVQSAEVQQRALQKGERTIQRISRPPAAKAIFMASYKQANLEAPAPVFDLQDYDPTVPNLRVEEVAPAITTTEKARPKRNAGPAARLVAE